MKKRWSILLITLVFFGSCLKEPLEPVIIIEPPDPVEVRLDTIEEGTLHNITIGDPAEKVYADLQLFAEDRNMPPYLSITGMLNHRIEDLKDRIPLYRALTFDRRPSSSEGGQIYFENHVIKAIYSRNGTRLLSWPRSTPHALRVGDSVSDIYEKLVKISAESRFAFLFDYIGMFHKNLETSYDHVQEQSDLWQFNFSIDDNQVMRLDLVFEAGILVKIRSRYERYP